MKPTHILLLVAVATTTASAAPFCEKKAPTDVTTEEAKRWELVHSAGCGGTTFDPYWFDLPELTDLERVSHVAACLDIHKPDRPEDVATVALWCGDDLAQLDAARLKTLLASLKLPRLEENFAHVAEWRSALAALREDKNWKRILEAKDKGAAAWQDSYKAHADDLKEAAGYVRAFEIEPGTAKGCSAKVHALMKTHLASRKPKNLEEVRAAIEDPVGYPLYVALGACLSVDKLSMQAIPLLYMPAPDGSMSSGTDLNIDPVRGPRLAGLVAANVELVKILESSPKFPTKSFGKVTFPTRYQELAGTMKAAHEVQAFKRAQGTIASLKPDKKGHVVVAFKTETVNHDLEDCKDTTKIHRIHTDGTVEYWQDCKVTGTEKLHVTPRSIIVAKDFTDGLKVGRHVTYFWEGSDMDDDGAKPGAIYAIWTNAKEKTMTGWGGFSW